MGFMGHFMLMKFKIFSGVSSEPLESVHMQPSQIDDLRDAGHWTQPHKAISTHNIYTNILTSL